MSPVHIVSLLTSLLLLVPVLEMLRRRQLREKYAVTWLLTALAVIILAIWPGLVDVVARSVHVVDHVNLLLFAAVAVLLIVCLHLSWESSRLEEETRTLAEEIALLRLEVEQQSRNKVLR